MPRWTRRSNPSDDMILKRMKGRNMRTDSIRSTEPIRRSWPDSVFGADLIAGFPKAKDDMFATALAAIRACGLTDLHIFQASPRPGTPVARMPQLPGKIVMARAARLRQEVQIALDAFLKSEIGQRRDVLAERCGPGRTPQFAGVAMERPPPAGVIVNVNKIVHDEKRLMGGPPMGHHLEAAPEGPDIEVRA